jgi:hypothetical protein
VQDLYTRTEEVVLLPPSNQGRSILIQGPRARTRKRALLTKKSLESIYLEATQFIDISMFFELKNSHHKLHICKGSENYIMKVRKRCSSTKDLLCATKRSPIYKTNNLIITDC